MRWRVLVEKVVTLREGEGATAAMMFAYSLLAMTAYNVLKPITRSQFITALGADNLPYVQLAAGVLIGVLMQLYSRGAALVPRRAVIPLTLALEAVVLTVFWWLFRTGAQWVSVAFYLLALVLGILMISQFWTLASDIYDARQAKRLFGFIGGGASLGGAAGAGLTAVVVQRLGTNNLLLVSAALLGGCAALVAIIIRREAVSANALTVQDERGVGGGEAFRMLRSSRHLQVIALLIGCAAIGASLIEQQLNMAAAAVHGGSADAITAFLANVTLYVSLAGLFVQIALTSRVHRSLGLAFALLLLPLTLGTTAVVILSSGALWAASVARVLDSSLRYTIDKTTREVLFLPLPVTLKYRAKPFVDVTVDRTAKAIGALLALVLIKPWGLHLDWRSLSAATLVVSAVWIFLAMRARREYLTAFRHSLDAGALALETPRLDITDASTIELLVQELSRPEASRVLRAIDILEMFGKSNLVTPLLLHHESDAVRARAIVALASAPPTVASSWMPHVERVLRDQTISVRAAAIHVLAAAQREGALPLVRRYLRDPEPRVAIAAAVALADSSVEADAEAAAAILARLVDDVNDETVSVRREVAAALAHVRSSRCRTLLVPLIHDADVGVAETAIRSARMLGPSDRLVVPALVARLGHRVLKSAAREVLISHGEEVCDVLAHVLHDPDEDPWVRRHVPGTLAGIATERSVEALAAGLDDPDGFLRYKIVVALERLRRQHPGLALPRGPVEKRLVVEARRYLAYLTLRFNLTEHAADAVNELLVRAIDEKLARSRDRIYRVLGLIHPWQDVAAARRALEHGQPRARAAALEYLDNMLDGAARKLVIPVLDDAPTPEIVRRANVLLRTRPRDLEDTLAQLVHDDDRLVSAAAVQLVARRRLVSLADDLRFAAAHDTRDDRLVHDAASSALRRLEGGADDGSGSLPIVEVIDHLYRIPLFRFVTIDELSRIASAGRLMLHGDGHELHARGTSVDIVLFLLQGRVCLRFDEGRWTEVEAPAALGFHEVLEGHRVEHRITALNRGRSLVFGAPQFFRIAADNILLAQGLFRILFAEIESRRAHAFHGPMADTDAVGARSSALQPLERVILLEQHPLFSSATARQLLALAAVVRDVPLHRGRVLYTEADLPALYYIVAGEVRLESGSVAPFDAGHGSIVGVAATLSGDASSGWRATVTTDGYALQIDRDRLFELLADDVDLLRCVFRGLWRFAHRDQAPDVEAAGEAPSPRWIA